MHPSPRIAHLLASETRGPRIERLRAIITGVGSPADHIVIRFGRATAGLTGGREIVIDASWGSPVLTGARLDQLTDACPAILHAWSPGVIPWAVSQLQRDSRPESNGPRGMIVECAFPLDAARMAGLPREPGTRLVTESQFARSAVLAAGADPARVEVISPVVDFQEMARIERGAARRAHGLGADDFAICLVPPVTRQSGGFLSAWACLLAQRVYHSICILVPNGGPESDRVLELASASKCGDVIRVTPEGAYSMAFAAADAAIWTPADGDQVGGLIQAMAFGHPVISVATPQTTEFLVHGQGARLSREATPQSLARRIVEAVESRGSAAGDSLIGRQRVFEQFGRARLLEAYRGVYSRVSEP